jgi:hypothetical protein
MAPGNKQEENKKGRNFRFSQESNEQFQLRLKTTWTYLEKKDKRQKWRRQRNGFGEPPQPRHEKGRRWKDTTTESVSQKRNESLCRLVIETTDTLTWQEVKGRQMLQSRGERVCVRQSNELRSNRYVPLEINSVCTDMILETRFQSRKTVQQLPNT